MNFHRLLNGSHPKLSIHQTINHFRLRDLQVIARWPAEFVQGYHWDKNEKEDEFSYVTIGLFIIDLEGRGVESHAREHFCA